MSTIPLNRRSLLGLFAGTTVALVSSNSSAEQNSLADDAPMGNGGLPTEGNVQLQAIGALGVGHIQSTLGLIGAIADSLSKSLYTEKQIEDLMTGTFNGLESPKRILRKLQDSHVSNDDAEFLDRMISVLNALQREARALTVYSKGRKPDDAVEFEKARRMVLKKLGDLTQKEDVRQTEQSPQRQAPQRLSTPVLPVPNLPVPNTNASE